MEFNFELGEGHHYLGALNSTQANHVVSTGKMVQHVSPGFYYLLQLVRLLNFGVCGAVRV